MNKTVKKLDNNVVKALTIVCENAKEEFEGFAWVTHQADYSNFPGSLRITCIFDESRHLDNLLSTASDSVLVKQIHQQLMKVGIVLKRAKHQVCFDSEQACTEQHKGDWQRRLGQYDN